MALRQRVWARKQTRRLRKLLGGKCADCGSRKNLEFDVIIINGKNDHHRKMEWSWRLSFYRREYDRNNLALRCDKCNGRKSDDLHLNTNYLEHPF